MIKFESPTVDLSKNLPIYHVLHCANRKIEKVSLPFSCRTYGNFVLRDNGLKRITLQGVVC